MNAEKRPVPSILRPTGNTITTIRITLVALCLGLFVAYEKAMYELSHFSLIDWVG